MTRLSQSGGRPGNRGVLLACPQAWASVAFGLALWLNWMGAAASSVTRADEPVRQGRAYRRQHPTSPPCASRPKPATRTPPSTSPKHIARGW